MQDCNLTKRLTELQDVRDLKLQGRWCQKRVACAERQCALDFVFLVRSWVAPMHFSGGLVGLGEGGGGEHKQKIRLGGSQARGGWEG